jgi:hypothetical protein
MLATAIALGVLLLVRGRPLGITASVSSTAQGGGRRRACGCLCARGRLLSFTGTIRHPSCEGHVRGPEPSLVAPLNACPLPHGCRGTHAAHGRHGLTRGARLPWYPRLWAYLRVGPSGARIAAISKGPRMKTQSLSQRDDAALGPIRPRARKRGYIPKIANAKATAKAGPVQKNFLLENGKPLLRARNSSGSLAMLA